MSATNNPRSLKRVTFNKVNNTNFGKSLSVLSRSNFDKYVFSTQSLKVLKEIDLLKEGETKKDQFYYLLANLMQTLSTRGFLTYEIFEYIHKIISKDQSLKEEITNSIKIVHTDYEKYYKNLTREERKILFNHQSNVDEDIGAYDRGEFIEIVNNSKKFKRDIKILGCFKKSKIENEMLGSDDPKKRLNVLNEIFDRLNINKDIVNPTKAKPSVSSILINNPKLRIGSQNEFQLSTFFNTISNIELAKAYPYFNATFIVPIVASSDNSETKNSRGRLISSSNAGQFLFGTTNNITNNYKKTLGNTIKIETSDQKKDNLKINANMSLFTTPQTLVNLNEKIGHTQNINPRNRLNAVIDSTQPLMTLKSVSINAAPTKGLMNFRSGKLSLVIHDRSRISDVASFIKPDLFGVFGAEVALEYGWSSIDSNRKNVKNPVGEFLSTSKVLEKFMIVNSSMNIDNNGLVNVDLSIAAKGSHTFRNKDLDISGGRNKYNVSNIKTHVTIIKNAQIFLGIQGESFSILNALSNNSNAIESRNKKITKDDLDLMSSFMLDYRFINKIKIEKLGIKYSGKLADNSNNSIFVVDKKTYEEIGINVTKKNKEMLDKILGLQGGNNKIIVQASNVSPSDVKNRINVYFNEIKNLLATLKRIYQEDLRDDESLVKMVESVIGGIGFMDPFFPAQDSFFTNLHNKGKYISLGSIINSLVITHLADDNEFDEIQTIFYTANEFAAGAAGESISKFLVDKDLLRDLLLEIFRKNAVVTLESIVTQILLKAVQKEDNLSFRLIDDDDKKQKSNIFSRRSSYNDPLIPNYSKDNIALEKRKKLHEIYFGKKNMTSQSLRDVKFVMPMISMNFDCISDESNPEITILRISIYDKCDNPFTSASEILERVYHKSLNRSKKSLIDIRNDFKKGSKSRAQFIKESLLQIGILRQEGILKKVSGSTDYKLKPFGEINQSKVKDVFKKIYPSLTFGSQNTALISANVSTINDNKLSTIFITRPERNNLSEINDRVYADLPLTILPTQASVEIIGCPWVNFGQHLFLDFETGTTIDNKYTVTGITHNFTPGKFTTNLTLSYGDNYGKIDSAAGVTSRALETVLPPSSNSNSQNLPPLDAGDNKIVLEIDPNYSFDTRLETKLLDKTSSAIGILNSFYYLNSFNITEEKIVDTSIIQFFIFKNSYLDKIFSAENVSKEEFVLQIKKEYTTLKEVKVEAFKQDKGSPLKVKRVKSSSANKIAKLQIQTSNNNIEVILDNPAGIFEPSGDNSTNHIDISKFHDYNLLEKFTRITESNETRIFFQKVTEIVRGVKYDDRGSLGEYERENKRKNKNTMFLCLNAFDVKPITNPSTILKSHPEVVKLYLGLKYNSLSAQSLFNLAQYKLKLQNDLLKKLYPSENSWPAAIFSEMGNTNDEAIINAKKNSIFRKVERTINSPEFLNNVVKCFSIFDKDSDHFKIKYKNQITLEIKDAQKNMQLNTINNLLIKSFDVDMSKKTIDINGDQATLIYDKDDEKLVFECRAGVLDPPFILSSINNEIRKIDFNFDSVITENENNIRNVYTLDIDNILEYFKEVLKSSFKTIKISDEETIALK